jgi:rhamnogalacturonan endolyase
LVFADMQGKILKHLRLGHAQTVTIANLMGDSSQVQIATNTFWGNPGIISVLNKEGEVLRSFQPSIYGSPLFPVNWTGERQKLLLLSARHTKEGGLYDGYGRQAVVFPDDGHPYLCCEAMDCKGDFRDEIICWDHDQLWIYTQDGLSESPPSTPRSIQPPLFNASNYRSNLVL